MSPADLDRWVARCYELARAGRGGVEPNPMVGAVVLTPDGQLIAEGYHRRFGGPHAEVEALTAAGERARGATLIVSLEPCSTTGKTPPCTELILRSGVARVVFAVEDPNPSHAGRARRILEEAGIELRTGIRVGEGMALLEGFVRYLSGRQPFVMAKWASTLDGALAAGNGHSQWITGEEARRVAHRLRASSQVVLVGVGTVCRDDPLLDVRLVEGRSPAVAIVDPSLRTPPGARLFGPGAREVLVFAASDAEPGRREALESVGARVMTLAREGDGSLPLAEILAMLRGRGRHRVMVEGGGRLLGALLEARLVDRVEIHLAPRLFLAGDARRIIGRPSSSSVSESLDLDQVEVETAGRDRILRGTLPKSSY